ncbi:MAG: hypothetical protein Q8P41_26205 [Pseudomonadota bacterium]|nr:hypothetical protein [Pseudomonadota bacterium]
MLSPGRRTVVYLAAIGILALLAYGYTTLAPADAPTAAIPAPEAPKKGKKARKAALRPAAEKACLPPPSDVGPEDMVASAGLDPGDVRTVMRAASQTSLACFGDSPSVTLRLSILVACTGVVAKVDVEDDGGASPEVQDCIQEALRAAEFPAHALPDGDRFEYPLRYTAPG